MCPVQACCMCCRSSPRLQTDAPCTVLLHVLQIFLKVLNKPLCMTAITILALTYLPGSIASIIQLYRGTKYCRFPTWLNAWLVSRRQLGLIALALVLLHAMASAMMLSPTYYSSWFQKPSIILPANVTEQVRFCGCVCCWFSVEMFCSIQDGLECDLESPELNTSPFLRGLLSIAVEIARGSFGLLW